MVGAVVEAALSVEHYSGETLPLKAIAKVDT